MKIILLELFKYKRLALNNIEYIKIEPENKIQLILGANGSGKSSLIKEFNPLPAVPNQFHKDGYKHVVIHHRNSVYDLKSSFGSSGNKFSFIKDDEELNPGGTVTVYKELVKKYFNITQEVIDLLNGNENFHSMSVNDRRNWFTKISDVDYSFALSYYSKLKEEQRDIQGAIKLNQSRLVQESEKLLSEEEESLLRDKIKTTNEFITHLLNIRQNQNNDRGIISSLIDEIEFSIKSYSDKIMSCYSDFYLEVGNRVVIDIDKSIVDAQVSIGMLEKEISEHKEIILEKSETLNLFRNSNLQSASEISDKIKIKVEELDGINFYTDIKISQPDQVYQAFSGIRSTITEIVSELEPNDDYKYSRNTYALILENISRLEKSKVQISSNTSALEAAKKELEHYKDHGLTECPKCDHRWFKGYDENKYQEILFGINANNTRFDEITKELEECNEKLAKIKSYFERYKLYNNLTSSYPILEPIWNYLSENNILLKEPQNISMVLNRIQSDLLTMIRLEQIKKELEELHKAKETLSVNESNTLASIEEDIKDHEVALITYMTNISTIRSELELYNTLKRIRLNVQEYKDKLEKLIVLREDRYKELIEINRRDSINSIIMELQLSNTKDEQTISKVDVQKALVENIKKQLDELNDKSEVYKILVKELSPTEGLIAKSLTGFINHFVFQINSFIKKIWSYPLELVPMNSDTEDEIDLDFKFGVKVNGDIPIPDVSNCSSAMKEVINLAFRIVSMKYLHLEDAPLFLDEFSSAMDHHHRQMAFHVITNLLTSANFSQIFLISHYVDSYGSLKNSDVTVLSTMNIVLPKDMVFNRRCEIK